MLRQEDDVEFIEKEGGKYVFRLKSKYPGVTDKETLQNYIQGLTENHRKLAQGESLGLKQGGNLKRCYPTIDEDIDALIAEGYVRAVDNELNTKKKKQKPEEIVTILFSKRMKKEEKHPIEFPED
jgi:hypothetical protein